MPELPEVETVRRQLEPEVVGRTIAEAEVLDERWTRPELPARVEAALTGREIRSVGRRGKYLVVGFGDDTALVMHLRMTGNLLIREPGADQVADLMATDRLGGPRLYETPPDARHLRARLVLDDDSELWFTDPRRFGFHNSPDPAATFGAYYDLDTDIENQIIYREELVYNSSCA
jgi:formamidopyrimidine-DNA glycosylase